MYLTPGKKYLTRDGARIVEIVEGNTIPGQFNGIYLDSYDQVLTSSWWSNGDFVNSFYNNPYDLVQELKVD